MVAGLFLSFPIFTRNRFLLFSKLHTFGFSFADSNLPQTRTPGNHACENLIKQVSLRKDPRRRQSSVFTEYMSCAIDPASREAPTKPVKDLLSFR